MFANDDNLIFAQNSFNGVSEINFINTSLLYFLTGLTSMLEIKDTEESWLVCVLCSRKLNDDTFEAHLQSVPHLKTYAMKFYPKKKLEYEQISRSNLDPFKNFIEEMKESEKQFGVGSIAICDKSCKTEALAFIKSLDFSKLTDLSNFLKDKKKIDPSIINLNNYKHMHSVYLNKMPPNCSEIKKKTCFAKFRRTGHVGFFKFDPSDNYNITVDVHFFEEKCQVTSQILLENETRKYIFPYKTGTKDISETVSNVVNTLYFTER